jgi:hypothetical protein
MAVAAPVRPLNVDTTIAELRKLYGERVSTSQGHFVP